MTYREGSLTTIITCGGKNSPSKIRGGWGALNPRSQVIYPLTSLYLCLSGSCKLGFDQPRLHPCESQSFSVPLHQICENRACCQSSHRVWRCNIHVVFILSFCSARIRRGNDIGTFGEKHRRSQVVQTGGVSVWIRISTGIMGTGLK